MRGEIINGTQGITIKWNCPNLYRTGDFRVMPGVNLVRPEIWEAVKNHPGVVQRLKKGDLVVMNQPPVSVEAPPVAPKPEVPGGADQQAENYDLKDYSFTDAMDIVKETLDLEVLKDWETKEDRKTVLAVIKSQIQVVSLEKKGEGKDEGDGEEGDEDK